MLRKSMKFFTFFLLILVTLSITAFGAEKKKFRLLTLEIEFLKVSNRSTVDNAGTINQVPLYLRTIPVHRNDPFFELKDLAPDNSPFLDSYSTSVSSSSIKVWLLSTIGFGKIFAYSDNGPYLTNGRSSIWSADQSDIVEGAVGSGKFNYAPYYSDTWGAAYIMYQLTTTEERGPGLFVELKTPTVNFYLEEKTWISLGLFGGYQPFTYRIKYHGLTGWHRYSSFEMKDRYELGEVEYKQVYGGLDFKFTYDRFIVGMKFFLAKDLKEVQLTDCGNDFGMEFRDLPIVYGVGMYLGFDIF